MAASHAREISTVKFGKSLMMMMTTFHQRQAANLYRKRLTSTVNSCWRNMINFALLWNLFSLIDFMLFHEPDTGLPGYCDSVGTRQKSHNNQLSQGLLESFCVSSSCNFFWLGCTAALVGPTSLGNFHKNCLANLVTELLTHSVVTYCQYKPQSSMHISGVWTLL